MKSTVMRIIEGDEVDRADSTHDEGDMTIGHDDAGGQLYVCREPQRVRAIDAFNAVCRQLGAMHVRVLEVETALGARAIGALVLALADLNSAWTLLAAQLDLAEAVSDTIVTRELWNLPEMQLACDGTRKVISQGTAFATTYGAGAGLFVQLHHLAGRLKMHEQSGSLAAQRSEARHHGVSPEREAPAISEGPSAALIGTPRRRRFGALAGFCRSAWRFVARHPGRKEVS